MIEIKIQDKSYDIPTEWKDITLKILVWTIFNHQ